MFIAAMYIWRHFVHHKAVEGQNQSSQTLSLQNRKVWRPCHQYKYMEKLPKHLNKLIV